MKRLLSISVTFLLLVIPAQVFAKGPTVKITIKGAALKSLIEITRSGGPNQVSSMERSRDEFQRSRVQSQCAWIRCRLV
jgi:hypothetical protein